MGNFLGILYLAATVYASIVAANPDMGLQEVYCVNVRKAQTTSWINGNYEIYRNGSWQRVRRGAIAKCISTAADSIKSHDKMPNDQWQSENVPAEIKSATHDKDEDGFRYYAYVPMDQGWLGVSYIAGPNYKRDWDFVLKIPELSNQPDNGLVTFYFLLPDSNEMQKLTGHYKRDGYVHLIPDYVRGSELNNLGEHMGKITSNKPIHITFTPDCKENKNGATKCAASEYYDSDHVFTYKISTRNIQKIMQEIEDKALAEYKQFKQMDRLVRQAYLDQLPNKEKKFNQWVAYMDVNPGKEKLIDYKSGAYKKEKSFAAFFANSAEQQVTIDFNKKQGYWLFKLNIPETAELNPELSGDDTPVSITMEVPGQLKAMNITGKLNIYRDKTGYISIGQSSAEQMQHVIDAMKKGSKLIMSVKPDCYYSGKNKALSCGLFTMPSFKARVKTFKGKAVNYSFSLKGSGRALKKVEYESTF